MHDSPLTANPRPDDPPPLEIAPPCASPEGNRSPKDTATPASPSAGRQLAEFLVVLVLGILVARTFTAEAYIVPTGSMAPTLLGLHVDYQCPDCGYSFSVGSDEQGQASRPVCPNCGKVDWTDRSGIPGTGDRLLVHKYLFDLRAPRRWEAAVFQNPADPAQAYVKRVVGLPGESVLIHGGDVFINGKIARKSLAEQRALRIPLYNNDFLPNDRDRYPRWDFVLGNIPVHGGGGWIPDGTGFRRPIRPEAARQADWLLYRHWQPDTGQYGPVQDFIAYNGLDFRGENRVTDLTIEATVSVGPEIDAVVLRLRSGGDRFLVSIPTDTERPVRLDRNGRPQSIQMIPGAPRLVPTGDGPASYAKLEASLVDHRLSLAINGHLLFEPFDYDDPTGDQGRFNASPIGIGVEGTGWAALDHLKIYRDVYYTDSLAYAPRQPFAVGEPFTLGEDEFFVLGDNSPVSNDSRFWDNSPVVSRELFLGRPFLVHLPSQAVPLEVFGHELYWFPDPRAIRYIR